MTRAHGGHLAEPEVSVVVPVYGNEESLRLLHGRLDVVLSSRRGYEIVFVDDASPDGSRSVLRCLAAGDPHIKVIELRANVGQHGAALAGMRDARGRWIVVMDADLQDPPEAIPLLLTRGGDGFDAVFAGRRGAYQGRWRMLTSRMYRAILARVLALPTGAGMFVAIRRDAARRIVAMDGPPSHVVGMIGAARLCTTSIPVERDRRSAGSSAYTLRSRTRSALLALRWAWWAK